MTRRDRRPSRDAAKLIAQARQSGHTLALVRQDDGEIMMAFSIEPAARRLQHKLASDDAFYAEVWRRLLAQQGIVGAP